MDLCEILAWSTVNNVMCFGIKKTDQGDVRFVDKYLIDSNRSTLLVAFEYFLE